MMPALIPTSTSKKGDPPRRELSHRDLIYANGIGGFTPDGANMLSRSRNRSGLLRLGPTSWQTHNLVPSSRKAVAVTPGSKTRTQFRLTPWYNDPITDRSGERLYLRDEDSGRYWSPVPLPTPGANGYVTRHGFGYSVFESEEHGIACELTIFVGLDGPVKYYLFKIHNKSYDTRLPFGNLLRRMGIGGVAYAVIAACCHRTG